jgi:capsular exopolysaccharide synthesis family protein
LELRHYFYLMRKWAWLVVLFALVGGAAAYAFSSFQAPVYEASSTLRVSLPNVASGAEYVELLASERLAQTFAQLLRKDPVLDGVIEQLGLQIGTSQLRSAVEVQPVRDTQLIDIKVKHTDPVVAQLVANEIPRVFVEQDRAMQASRYAKLKDSLAYELDEIQNDMRRLQESIANSRAEGAGEGDADLVVLENDLAQARSRFSVLLRNLGEVELAEAQSGSNVLIVAEAKLPIIPVGPQRSMNTLLAAVAGAMLAVGVVLLLEHLDDTVKTPDDVQTALSLATLGMVEHSSNGRVPFPVVTGTAARSSWSEAYRTLRTNIQFSDVDRQVMSLVLTSASPREGKTTTVANLGLVMAQAGQSVTLVDADLRRPDLHKPFHLNNRQGLTNALVDEHLAADMWMQETETEKLQVMTSGPLPPNPSELLGSRRMRLLIDDLEARADLVLFDSPPVAAITDAAVLAKQVDGALLVVEAGRTRRGMLKQAYENLERVGVNVLGVVLNKVVVSRGNYYYYYYRRDSEYYLDDGQEHWGRRWRPRWRKRRRTRHADPLAVERQAAEEQR